LDSTQSFVKCPWHGWEYDIRTGQSSFNPLHDRVRAYGAGVESGESLVAESEAPGRVTGPYVVETVSVSVSGNYVIVDTGTDRAAKA
jgi:nitrite reductase/ring-hydroxylating ferredoxin subunit